MTNRYKLYAVLFVLSCLSGSVSADWEWTYPRPQGNGLEGVWMHSSSDIFVAGDAGVICHYDGLSWSQQYYDHNTFLNGIWGSSPTNVFAVGYHNVGYGGVILHYNGSAWSLQTGENDDIDFVAVWGTSETEVWVLGNDQFGSGAEIWRWNGHAWSVPHEGLQISANAIWGTGPDNLYIAGYGAIYHWNGIEWAQMLSNPDFNYRSIWGASDSAVYVCASRNIPQYGAILYWNGIEWNQIYYESNKALYCIFGTDESNVIAGGINGTIIHINGIQTYDRTLTGGTGLKSVSSLGPDSSMIAGEWGALLKWDGIQWSYIVKNSVRDMTGIWGFGPDDVVAVGEYWYDEDETSRIVRWNGAQWTDMPTGIARLDLTCVWGASPDNIYAAGIQGISDAYLIHWNGISWSHVDIGDHSSYNALWGSSAGDIFLVGGSGTICHFNGSNWSDMAAGPTWHLTSVWGTAHNDVFAVGYSGIIVHYDGNSWTQMNYPEHPNLRDVWGTAHDNVYAVGGNFILHYDGVDWQEVEENAYRSWETIWGTAPDNIYAAAQSGYIEHFDGVDWVEVNSPVLGTCNEIWGCSEDDIFIAVRNGVIRSKEAPVTPTPPPTSTPASTQIPTASPTSTPTPLHVDLGVELHMPATYFNPGDLCGLSANIYNSSEPMTDIPLFVILQILNEFWFWPSWNTAGDFQLETISTGISERIILDLFEWPDTGSDSMDGLMFWSAMTDSAITEVLGGVDGIGYWEFGFGP